MKANSLSVRKTIKSFIVNLSHHPYLVIPFVLSALFDFIALISIYLAPRYPLSRLMAPPIRRFFGEQYLHYPKNFILIPRLFNYAHIVISFTIGIFMTAVFIFMLYKVLEKKGKILKEPVVLPSIKRAFVKFIPMFLFFLVFYVLTLFVFKGISHVFNLIGDNSKILVLIHLGINFIASVIMYATFAMVFPAIVIEDNGLITAMITNFDILRKHFRRIALLMLIPSTLYLVIALNKFLAPRLMAQFEPEILLISISVTIVLTAIIDLFMTGFSTSFYMIQKHFND